MAINDPNKPEDDKQNVPNMNGNAPATQAPQPTNAPGQPASQAPQGAQSNTPQFRQAAGNSSVSKLMNFARANQGNTQGMANQMNNTFNAQVAQAGQNMNNYNQGDASQKIGNAAGQAQNIYKLGNSLGNQQGVQNFAQAALGTNNQFRSGLDSMMLGTGGGGAIQNLQQNAQNQAGNALGKLNQYTNKVGGGDFQNFNAQDFAQKNMPSNMQQYFNQGGGEGDTNDYTFDQEGGDEQAGGGFMGNLQGAAQAGVMAKLGQSNPMLAAALGGQNMMTQLQAGNKVGAADAGVGMAAGTMFGPAGGMAYQMIPESARQQMIGTGMKGYEKLGMNTDFMNVNDPKAAAKAALSNAMGGKYVGGTAKKILAKPAAHLVSSITCHVKNTLVVLDDGTIKPIQEIKLGDKLMLGGIVTARGEAFAPETTFAIDGISASKEHALYTDGEWVRLEDVGYYEEETYDYVYPLVTENHLIVTMNQHGETLVWADMNEIDNTYDFTDEQILDILNSDVKKKTMIEEFYANNKNLREKRL